MRNTLTTALFVASLAVSALASAKEEKEALKPVETVKQCQRDCKSYPGAEAYERCMLQCKNIDVKGSPR